MWLFFFNIASVITITAAAFRRWTSDVIQPSSLGFAPAAAVVKEFHTEQTTAARITATNIAPITVLKLPQRSSCADLQNRESLNAVGDHTRPHAPFKVLTVDHALHAPSRASRLCHAPTRAATRFHTPARASFSCWHQPYVTSSATSSFDVICHGICWRHRWPDRWLALTLIVDFD